MADVNVTVMIDGKAAFVAGAVGAPDGMAVAITALQFGIAHFQAIKATATPQTPPVPAKDTSL
jgi:hypothetical protein